MTNSPSITLLMPTLNEVEGLNLVFPRINRDLFDDVALLDGGSTDGTVEFAQKNNIRVIRQQKSNLSIETYDVVNAMKTDYVITFSPDNNCIPEQLPDIVAKIKEGYDMVVVSRYLPPAKSEDDSLVTAFGNWMFSTAIRWLGKFPVTDALTMYRGYRCDVVRKNDFHKYVITRVYEPLLSAMCNLHGAKYCEIPGDEPKRVGGVTKMSVMLNGTCILLMIIAMYGRKIKMLFCGNK